MASKLPALTASIYVFCVSFILLSHYIQHANGIPTGTLVPSPIYNVLEGDTAVFTCNVTGTNGESLRWQAGTGMTSSVSIIEDARFTGRIYPDFVPNTIHGIYDTSYKLEGDKDVLSLRIVNVTMDDSGLLVNCQYESGTSGFMVIGVWSELIVWTKPTSQAHCEMQHDDEVGPIPTVITGGMTFDVILKCVLTEGLPLPPLTWFEVVNDVYITLDRAETETTQASYRLFIGAHDHGREFICLPSVAGILEESLSCSLSPYNPMPIITVTPNVITTVNKSISVLCNNTGTTTNNIIYNWYIDSTLINNDPMNGIHITQTMTYSTLVIGDLSVLSNSNKITCEGAIPGIPSVNASVTVTIEIPDSTRLPTATTITYTTDSPPKDMPMVIFIAAAAGGGFILIILVVIIIVCLVRRTHGSSKVDKDNSMGVTNLSVEMDGVNHNVDKSNAKGVSSGEPTSTDSSPNVAPINALPNKGQQLEESADTLTHGLPNKTKTERIPTQYEDVGLLSVNDDVSGTSKIDNGSPVGTNADANAEGLTYADLEISRPGGNNDLKTDEILGKDDMTVYSQVKYK